MRIKTINYYTVLEDVLGHRFNELIQGVRRAKRKGGCRLTTNTIKQPYHLNSPEHFSVVVTVVNRRRAAHTPFARQSVKKL